MPKFTEVRVVNELPGLPYSAAYASWNEHVEQCGHCARVLQSAAFDWFDRTSTTLCETGEAYDAALRGAIETQRKSAESN
jgi:hypothetical protein